MKTKILSLLLATVYFLALFTNVAASEPLSSASTSNEAFVISKDNFSQVFSGPKSEAMVAKLFSEKSLSTTSAFVTNIQLTEDVLSCSLTVAIGDRYITLPISGTLASGVRTQTGMNSIIVEVPDKVNGYTVRLFEIINDQKEDTWLLYSSVTSQKSVSGQPHMRIYLEDNQGILYLFECALPKALQKLYASDYPQADKYKDAILWATDIVEHHIEEFPVTGEVLDDFGLTSNSRGLDEYTLWAPDSGYRDTFYVGNTKNICSSLPYLSYMHSNLESSADTTWVASFKVAEHNNCGGTTLYGYNPFYYTNLDISIACGNYTTILESVHEGRMYEFNGSTTVFEYGSSITIGLLKHTSNSHHVASTFATVLGILDNLADLPLVYDEIELGSPYTKLSGKTVLAVRENLTDRRFSECTDQPGHDEEGDYFTIHIDVKRLGTPQTTATTTGLLMLSFDVCYSGTKKHTLYATLPLGYTVYAPNGG
ncbi:MAG: hypothetical protein E7439_02655 [Ruminococcaceae bacterium]|nr:hypothetical protein [Oscillospiraceae bacterium]